MNQIDIINIMHVKCQIHLLFLLIILFLINFIFFIFKDNLAVSLNNFTNI